MDLGPIGLLRITWCLVLFAGCATAQSDPNDHFISTLALRQADSLITDCDAPCRGYGELKFGCITSHCDCTVIYLQAKANCSLCTSTAGMGASNQGFCTACTLGQINSAPPHSSAGVQISLDEGISKCHREKIYVDFQLDLPPEAVAIVQQYYRDNAFLRRMQAVFLALQIAGGHIGLLVVLLFAIFSGRVHRDPTFINFCITWIISSVVFSMLLYRGTDGNTTITPLAHASDQICLAQAALTEGVQVMTVGSTLALIIQLWISTRAAIDNGPNNGVKQKRITRWTTCMLLVIPYILFIIFTLTPFFIGWFWYHIRQFIGNARMALPTRFYCAMFGNKPQMYSFRHAANIVKLGLLTLTVIFDLLIIRLVFRRWWYFRHVQAQGAVPLSVLLRVIVFTLYRVVVVITVYLVSNVGLPDWIPIWSDMLQAALPIVAATIFGVNRELIQSCMFWRRAGTNTDNDTSARSVKPVSKVISTGDVDETASLEADAGVTADRVGPSTTAAPTPHAAA